MDKRETTNKGIQKVEAVIERLDTTFKPVVTSCAQKDLFLLGEVNTERKAPARQQRYRAKTYKCGPYHRMFIVLSGKYLVKANGIVYAFKKGDVVLVRPLTRFSGDLQRKPAPYHIVSCFHVGIKRACLVEVQCNRKGKLTLPAVAGGPNSLAAIRLHDKLLALAPYKNECGPAINRWLGSLCALYRGSLAADLKIREQNRLPDTTQQEFEKISAIRYYINRNYRKEISTRQLADKYALSAGYLNKLFKKVFGLKIKEQYNLIKVSQAIDLMITNQYPLFKVSEKVGIKDPYYFSRLFKNYTGYSPSGFRKQFIGSAAQ